MTNTAIEDRIDQLLAKMSEEEKIGQLALRDWGIYDKQSSCDALKQAIREGRVGGFLNIAFSKIDNQAWHELQKIAVEESPNKIPLIYGQDVIHGYKTIFPIPLGQAATWDPSIIEDGARIAAKESSSDGIHWTFAPMIDIARDPRWGRIAESLGEDPYLCSVLGAAMVKGFQGEDPTSPDRIAACAKHFVGYGAAEGGRDYNSAYIPEGTLRDVYLAPFKACVNEGLMSIMTTYSTLNDIPGTADPQLLKGILRDEWQFEGFVVSDFDSVVEMIPHGFATDRKHAAILAADAGVDFEMNSTCYEEHLAEHIAEGRFSQTQLDQAVRHMLRIKMQLGLWENPYPRGDQQSTFLCNEHLTSAQKAARESLVLLKNAEQVLPIKQDQTIALIGPMADAAHDQLGTWIYDGEKKDTRTLLPALCDAHGADKVLYQAGLKYSRDTNQENFADCVETAKQADIIIFAGGEEAILSGEAHSRGNINLPGAQEELLTALAGTGKPIILLIMAGRPLALRQTLQQAHAVLMAWHPGTMGGPALAEVLVGKYSPSGRLPLSWPVDVGQVPIHYNHMNTGRPATDENYTRIDKLPLEIFQHEPGNTSNLLDFGHRPQFPFGFGLSYSEFRYDNLSISSKEIDLDGRLEASIELTNFGQQCATETVQLYIQDLVASRTRPVRELKGFSRVTLDPGETQTVTFTLHSQDLAFHNTKMELITEPGAFKLWIGANAEEGLETRFEVKAN